MSSQVEFNKEGRRWDMICEVAAPGVSAVERCVSA